MVNTCYNIVRGEAMKVSEFIRKLSKKGVKFESHGKNHDWYYNPVNDKRAQLPRHQSQEIKTGLAQKILKDLGLK